MDNVSCLQQIPLLLSMRSTMACYDMIWFRMFSNVKVHIALHYSSCSPLPCCPSARQDQTWLQRGSRTCAPKHSPSHFHFHFDKWSWYERQHIWTSWLQTKKLNWPHHARLNWRGCNRCRRGQRRWQQRVAAFGVTSRHRRALPSPICTSTEIVFKRCL